VGKDKGEMGNSRLGIGNMEFGVWSQESGVGKWCRSLGELTDNLPLYLD